MDSTFLLYNVLSGEVRSPIASMPAVASDQHSGMRALTWSVKCNPERFNDGRIRREKRRLKTNKTRTQDELLERGHAFSTVHQIKAESGPKRTNCPLFVNQAISRDGQAVGQYEAIMLVRTVTTCMAILRI